MTLQERVPNRKQPDSGDREQLERFAAMFREHSHESCACEECGAPVSFGMAAGVYAEIQIVLCDDCRLDAQIRRREQRLTEDDRVIRAARQGRSITAAANLVGLSRHAFRRATRRIDHKLESDCPGCRLCSATTRAKPRTREDAR